MTMTQISPPPQAFTSGRRADAVEGEIFQSLDPATGGTLWEARTAAPEKTSRRWQDAGCKTEAVTSP